MGSLRVGSSAVAHLLAAVNLDEMPPVQSQPGWVCGGEAMGVPPPRVLPPPRRHCLWRGPDLYGLWGLSSGQAGRLEAARARNPYPDELPSGTPTHAAILSPPEDRRRQRTAHAQGVGGEEPAPPPPAHAQQPGRGEGGAAAEHAQ